MTTGHLDNNKHLFTWVNERGSLKCTGIEIFVTSLPIKFFRNLKVNNIHVHVYNQLMKWAWNINIKLMMQIKLHVDS